MCGHNSLPKTFLIATVLINGHATILKDIRAAHSAIPLRPSQTVRFSDAKSLLQASDGQRHLQGAKDCHSGNTRSPVAGNCGTDGSLWHRQLQVARGWERTRHTLQSGPRLDG